MVARLKLLHMDALRLAGFVVLGVIVLWLALQIVSVIFSIVSWIVSAVISVLVLAALLYVGYLLVSRVL